MLDITWPMFFGLDLPELLEADAVLLRLVAVRQIEMTDQTITRIEGRLKVTGQAVYAAETPAEGLLHAALVEAPIASGKVVRLDAAAARKVAGFADIVTTDLTSDWAPYATDRLQAWRANHAAYAAIHGEGAYAAQELFYTVIARLYVSGSLGGVRLTARRPALYTFRMKLYSGPLSLFSRKVEIALGEKKLGFEREMVPFSQSKGYAPKHPAVLADDPVAAQRVPGLHHRQVDLAAQCLVEAGEPGAVHGADEGAVEA